MIKPIKLSDIPGRNVTKTPQVVDDLKDFMQTSAVAGEIRIPEGKKAKYMYAIYHNAIRRLDMPLEVMVRGERIFVVKKRSAPGGGTPKGGK